MASQNSWLDSTVNFVEETNSLLWVNWFMAELNLIFIFIALFLLVKRDIRDTFVRCAMILLLLACTLRLSVSATVGMQLITTYEWPANLTLQQLYFDLPFYAYVCVTIALMTSWRQFHRHIDEYVQGPQPSTSCTTHLL